jgi:hypothetical protein
MTRAGLYVAFTAAALIAGCAKDPVEESADGGVEIAPPDPNPPD